MHHCTVPGQCSTPSIFTVTRSPALNMPPFSESPQPPAERLNIRVSTAPCEAPLSRTAASSSTRGPERRDGPSRSLARRSGATFAESKNGSPAPCAKPSADFDASISSCFNFGPHLLGETNGSKLLKSRYTPSRSGMPNIARARPAFTSMKCSAINTEKTISRLSLRNG